jgi:hypothetical protein
MGGTGEVWGNESFPGASSQNLATDRLSELQSFGMLNPIAGILPRGEFQEIER